MLAQALPIITTNGFVTCSNLDAPYAAADDWLAVVLTGLRLRPLCVISADILRFRDPTVLLGL